MRQRSFIVLALAVVILILGAVAVYAYDKTRDDVIAKGVTAGGIDLSGMKPAEARDLLNRELAQPLQRSVTVKYAGKHWRISARRARVHVDTDEMVDEALQASRSGNLVSRSWRSITGGSVNKSIDTEISYSNAAVTRFAHEVKKDVDQPARDAKIDISASGVKKVDSQDGRELEVDKLAGAVQSELLQPAADHKVKATVKSVHSKVTTADLAKKYPHVIIVNRGAFELTLYRNLKVEKTYRIAVGQAGLETPAGRYTIQDKQIDPSWHVPNSAWAGSLAGSVIPPGPSNPLKARWMGIYNGAGIHGTSDIASLGSAASHGCIRMAVPDVIDLFDRVDVGDPVFIS